MRKARVGGIAGAALVAAVGIALLAAAPANADVSGPCTAHLNGTDLTNLGLMDKNAVVVGKDDVVPMTMSSSNGTDFKLLHITLAFAGVGWTVYSAPASGGTWSHNVDVHSFAKYGVGYYLLKCFGTFTNGDTCWGSALVKVTGDPLSTVAGIAGAAASGAGVLSVFGAGVAAGGGGGGSGPGGSYTQEDAIKDEDRRRELQGERDTEEAANTIENTAGAVSEGHCFLFAVLLLPLILLLGTSAALMAVAVPAVQIKRRSWPFALGAFGGLLTGLGAGVLLQEYAIIYPDRKWAIIYIAGGILFGLAVPWLRRSLSR